MSDPETDADADASAETDLGNDPEEAFGLVANELRFEIVEALWDALTDGEAPLAFSELRERVGLRDSGQFNYHLGKLTPRFVRQVEGGYELAYAGQRIVGAAVSGTYTDADVTVDPVVAGDCPQCDAAIEAAYDQGSIVIECTGCDLVITDGLPAPPVLAAHHDPEELPAVFNRLVQQRIRALTEGFCSLCGGPVDSTPIPFLDDDHGSDPDDGHVGVAHQCRACEREIYSAATGCVLDHPTVAGAYADHGVDLRETPVWELDWIGDSVSTVESERPPRLRIALEVGDEVVRVTVDDDCEVVDAEREPV